MFGKLPKKEQVTVELKTHKLEIGFSGGGRIEVYKEDTLCDYAIRHGNEESFVQDGLKMAFLDYEQEGFILADPKKKLYRPHRDIAYIQAVESTVTSVVTLEKQSGDWVVVGED